MRICVRVLNGIWLLWLEWHVCWLVTSRPFLRIPLLNFCFPLLNFQIPVLRCKCCKWLPIDDISLTTRLGTADRRCLFVAVVSIDGEKFGTQPRFFFCASFSFAPLGWGPTRKVFFSFLRPRPNRNFFLRGCQSVREEVGSRLKITSRVGPKPESGPRFYKDAVMCFFSSLMFVLFPKPGAFQKRKFHPPAPSYLGKKDVKIFSQTTNKNLFHNRRNTFLGSSLFTYTI